MKTKRKSLRFSATLALLALTLLAAGLSNLRFEAAQGGNLGKTEIRPAQEYFAEAKHTFSETPLIEQILLVGGFLLAVAIGLIVMPPEFRKAFLNKVFWISLFAAIILVFAKPSDAEPQIILPEESIGANAPLGEEDAAEGINIQPAETFNAEKISPVWGYLITLVTLLIVAILFWWLWRVWDQARQVEEHPQKELQRIARASLDDLAEGAEWEDVIIRSYVEMGKVVNERRGIARDVEMTPHEFAQRLVSAGLPANPVRELTRLFERVRYSPHTADEREVARAVACLEEIAETFGEKL